MSTTTESHRHASRPIALIDLAAQQARIRERVDRAIARVLDHGQYIMGPEVADLERRLAAHTGAGHVVSCASGTDALLIAMMSLGLGRGDAVLCPAFTFTATPEAIVLLGATPVFVDVDLDTHNIAPESIAAGLDTARAKGLEPRGIIAVDLFGLAADYTALSHIAASQGLWIIADAAQSFGAARDGRKTGTFGATSFFPAKPLGCYGDGGAIFTDDDALAEVMVSIRSHGKATGGDKYDIARIGVNGRLDTIQAAILIEKLAIFDEEVALRQAVARRYSEELDGVVTVPRIPDGCVSVWAQYTIRVPATKRAPLAAALADEKIPTAIYYPRPLHHQTAYAAFPVAGNGAPNAERLSAEVLSLPMHPYLEPEDQDRIVAAIRRAMGRI